MIRLRRTRSAAHVLYERTFALTVQLSNGLLDNFGT
jgi:hypothetical protein